VISFALFPAKTPQRLTVIGFVRCASASRRAWSDQKTPQHLGGQFVFGVRFVAVISFALFPAKTPRRLSGASTSRKNPPWARVGCSVAIVLPLRDLLDGSRTV